MGSLNKSHHEQSGGVVIFNGELILLYCDAVQCEVDSHGSVKGRIYLTTHRVIFTATPITQNANVKSFTAPFYAMFDLSLEQPVFGANFIKGKVRGEEGMSNFAFKLRFNKGGAIEFGQTMSTAAKQADRMARETAFQPPPAYTPSAAQYYQAPNNVYQPSYPIGFALPVGVFPDAPPPGFIYATDAPPPYPGLTTLASQQQQQQVYPQQGYQQQVYPQQGVYQQQGYPQQSPYQQQGYPQNIGFAAGYGAPFGSVDQPHVNMNAVPNGAASAPYQQNEQPPSYDQATKKAQ